MSYDTMKLWREIKKDKKTKAALCYFIGNLFNKGIAFILVPIFSRIMSQEEYGILNTYLSWEAILVVIVGLSLGQSLRSAVYDFKEDIEEYIVSIYALSFVDLIGTFIIITAAVKVFSLEYSIYLIFLCVLHAYFGFAVGVYEVRYMMEFRYLKRTILLVAPNLLYAVISIPLMLLLNTNRYMAGIYGYLITFSVIGIFLIINSLKGNKKRVNIGYWKYALKFSFPLIAHSLSMVVLSNSDRIMITNIRGSADTAIYSIVYSISMVPLAINASLENVWIPWFSNKLNAGDKEAVNRKVFSYIMIVLLITIGIMFVAPEVLMLLTPKEYWSGKELIPPIIAASFVMFVYSISADAEYYYKNTGIIAKSTIVAATSNIILNALFIPIFGSVAAAYTTLASYLISCVLHIFQMKRIDKELFPIKNYTISFVIMGSAMSLEMVCMDLFLIRWGATIVIGVMILKILMKVKKSGV